MNNNNNENDSTVVITDISLAAYLHLEGFVIVDVNISSFPTKFVFQDNSGKLSKSIYLWKCGKAEGNLFQYYRSYKEMIARVKHDNEKSRRER